MRPWLLVGIALLAGCVQAEEPAEEPVACPGHWHSTFQVWVDDERVDLDAYTLESGRLPLAMHIHAGQVEHAPYEVHWEPAVPRCASMDALLDAVDTRLRPDGATFTGLHEDTAWGGVHEAQVHAFVRDADGPWTEVGVDEALQGQPADGSSMLFLVGDHTPARVEEILAGVPRPPTYRP